MTTPAQTFTVARADIPILRGLVTRRHDIGRVISDGHPANRVRDLDNQLKNDVVFYDRVCDWLAVNTGKDARHSASDGTLTLHPTSAMDPGSSPATLAAALPAPALAAAAIPLPRPDHVAGVTDLPVTSLFTDDAYQRVAEPRAVARMVLDWDERLVGVLEVSDRGDGTYAVVDGGHRLCAMLEMGRTTATCHVHTGLTIVGEAMLFAQIDRTRRKLGTWDLWAARRAQGEPIVLEIERIAADQGLKVIPTTLPGTLRATATCEKIVRLGGRGLLEASLSHALAAFGADDADTTDGHILHAIAYFKVIYPDVEPEELVNAMRALVPRQLKARGAAELERRRGNRPGLIAHVLVDLVNSRRPAHTRKLVHFSMQELNHASRTGNQGVTGDQA